MTSQVDDTRIKTEASPCSKKKPDNAWCCTGLWDPLSNQPIVQPVIGDRTTTTTNDDDSVWRKTSSSSPSSHLDLTTAPDWMEWIEMTEDRSLDEGGAGAYDTMRCDLQVIAHTNNQEEERRHSCWGEDYHLDRLEQSYLSLLDASARNNLPNTILQSARKESKLLLQALTEEAKKSGYLKNTSHTVNTGDQDHSCWIQIIKLTLLWSLPKDKTELSQEASTTNNYKIVVRGHACSTGKLLPVFKPVQPIWVTAAILDGHHSRATNTNTEDSSSTEALPTRFQNPQSKVASWCKQRKKMENPETYKPPGVSEVLMVKPSINNNNRHFSSLELLEGLTSNVFVVYKDGTLRTAQEGVLFGYVRHLVLQSAAKCQLEVDTTLPIPLQDAVDGKWSEVFITSSSRLIYPISRILLPASDMQQLQNTTSKMVNGVVDKDRDKGNLMDEFVEFWRDPRLTDEIDKSSADESTPKWQQVLDEILRCAGYER